MTSHSLQSIPLALCGSLHEVILGRRILCLQYLMESDLNLIYRKGEFQLSQFKISLGVVGVHTYEITECKLFLKWLILACALPVLDVLCHGYMLVWPYNVYLTSAPILKNS